MIKIKTLLISVVLAFVVLGACYGAFLQGTQEGIKAYHSQCFEAGGFIVDNEGHVVICAPQGTIPKEEIDNFKGTI